MTDLLSALPSRAIILARISDARRAAEDPGRKDTRGVDGQVADLRAFAGRLGWTVGPDRTHVIIENDVSAYRRRMCLMPDGRRVLRPYRPRFWRAVQMIRDGSADGFLCLDLDRCVRDPLDLEDISVAVDQTGALVDSITGTFRLASTSDLATARIMVAVASKSSADTARRVAVAQHKGAVAGRFTGGPRPYGYRPVPGVRGVLAVDEAEAVVIRWMTDQVLRKVPLRAIALALRTQGKLTSKGGPWSATAVRNVLLNPRIAGLVRYRPNPKAGMPRTIEYRVTGDDKIVNEDTWPKIIEPDTWRAVRSILTDPTRTVTPGPSPKWLVSLIATCGVCHAPVTVRTSGRNKPIYRCPVSHIERLALDVDRYVTLVVVGRLSQADVITDQDKPDLAKIREEAAAVRELMNEQARLHAEGILDTQQLAEGTKILRTRLEAAERQLGDSADASPLAGVTGPTAAAKWQSLSLGHRREIVRRLLDIEILPVPLAERDGRAFDPDYVKLTRKR